MEILPIWSSKIAKTFEAMIGHYQKMIEVAGGHL